jgi:uncharacterized membrane protein
MSTLETAPEAAAQHIEDHPLVGNVNAMQHERLSPTERVCRQIADATGAPIALVLAIIIQLAWVVAGTVSHWDPYPFAFLLTCSNMLQLVLIFVIAVAQRQQTMHDELRAEADHATISRLLYHQEMQDRLLLRLAERAGVDVADLKPTIESLLAKAS